MDELQVDKMSKRRWKNDLYLHFSPSRLTLQPSVSALNLSQPASIPLRSLKVSDDTYFMKQRPH